MKAIHWTLGGLLFVACGDGTTVDPVPQPELSCSIDTDQIFSGGVSRDGIPSLQKPQLVKVSGASFMKDDDRILGVEVNGAARAYPMGILWWHEVVNDTLGGEPLLLSYCPLTGSGIAFDPRVDGVELDFGVSGLLFLSNLIMFDRNTGSLWNQMLLGSQCGMQRGKALTRIPVTETTWAKWRSDHPNTTLLSVDQGDIFANYFEYPYGDYDVPTNSRVDFLAPGVTFSTERPAKELVLGVFDGDAARAFSFGLLDRAGPASVINDVVGDEPVLVTYIKQWREATAYDRRVDGQTLTFSLATPGPLTFTDSETGSTWNAMGVATSGPMAGKQLSRYTDSYVAFWFAWSLYYPAIQVHQ